MMSLPPNRCGFSKLLTATLSPVSKSTSSRTIVVVPRSMASPKSAPRKRPSGTESWKTWSSSRVTTGARSSGGVVEVCCRIRGCRRSGVNAISPTELVIAA